MDTKAKLLPLGSVVRGRDSIRLVIVARAVVLTLEGESAIFDYGACVYPIGIIGDTMLYLNSEDIVEVISQGFSDHEDLEYLQFIDRVKLATPIVKGDAHQFRDLAMKIFKNPGSGNE